MPPLCNGSRSGGAGTWTLITGNRSDYYKRAVVPHLLESAVLPREHAIHSACRLPDTQDSEVFERIHKCALAPPLEAVSKLWSNGTQGLWFVGDSVLYHLRMSTAVAHLAMGGSHRWPVNIEWFCVPETDIALFELFRGAGLWSRAPHKGAVVLNFGLWYNLETNRSCACSLTGLDGCLANCNLTLTNDCPASCEQAWGNEQSIRSAQSSTTGLENCPNLTQFRTDHTNCTDIASREEATSYGQYCHWERWQESRQSCRSAPPRLWTNKPGYSHPCAVSRSHICRHRREQWDLDQCAYARDVTRLALWIEANSRHVSLKP
jgi:hypothetical protein